MIRTKVKGTKFKAASSPEEEPNFYKMAPVTVTPNSSDCDHSENDDCSSGHDSYSKGSSDATMMAKKQAFQPPHQSFDDPLPLEYATLQPQEAPVSPMVNKLAMQIFGSDPVETRLPQAINSQMSFEAPIPVNMASNYVSSPVAASAPSIPMAQSNDYLDQAIEELFLEDAHAANEVMDFVNAWDEDFQMGPVNNDLELGNLLDKILQEWLRIRCSGYSFKLSWERAARQNDNLPRLLPRPERLS